jgi:hypothetical protein
LPYGFAMAKFDINILQNNQPNKTCVQQNSTLSSTLLITNKNPMAGKIKYFPGHLYNSVL